MLPGHPGLHADLFVHPKCVEEHLGSQSNPASVSIPLMHASLPRDGRNFSFTLVRYAVAFRKRSDVSVSHDWDERQALYACRA